MLFWLLSAIFREASLGRNRLRRPKRFYTTPKAYVDTARSVIRYTNQARVRHNLRPLSVISPYSRPPKDTAIGWLGTAFPTRGTRDPRLTSV